MESKITKRRTSNQFTEMATSVLQPIFLDYTGNKLPDWDKISNVLRSQTYRLEPFLAKINWQAVSLHCPLYCSVLDKHRKRVDWQTVSRRKPIPVSVIAKFGDRLNMRTVSRNHCLDDIILRKYSNAVDWDYISRHYPLRVSFVVQFYHLIDWCAAATNNTDALQNYAKSLVTNRVYLHTNDLDAHLKAQRFMAERLPAAALLSIADRIDWPAFSAQIHYSRSDLLLPLRDYMVWRHLRLDKDITPQQMQAISQYVHLPSVLEQIGEDHPSLQFYRST
jgi:hypothetical protein